MAQRAPLLAFMTLASPLFRACAIASALLAMPARADVMEVAPGGTVTIYKVPIIFSESSVRQIQVERPAARAIPPPFQPSDYVGSAIVAAAERYSLDPDFLRSLAWRESRFHYNAISPKGAFGVMQLMAGTARDLGIDRYDVSQNIMGGAAYLRQMMDHYNGDRSLALAAYNSGPGAVDRYHGIPPFPETKAYVQDIIGAMVPAGPRPFFVISIDP